MTARAGGKAPSKGPRYGFRSPEAQRFPEMVVCGMAFRCNARCVHCPNAATGFNASLSGKDQLMNWDVLKRVASECAEFPHTMVRVSSCGETLVHPSAIDMIEHLLKVKTDKNVVLTTNGSLLDANKSKRLLDNGIRGIEFSMDAHNARLYGKIRRGLNFEAVMRNLDQLVAIRDQGKYATRIMVSVIEQSENKMLMEDIVRFWEAKADRVLVRKLLTFKGVILRDIDVSAQLEAEAPCPFLWERLMIDSAGNIRGCVSDLYNESCLGNISEQTIAAIWSGSELNRWRRLHMSGQAEQVPVCKGCCDMEYRSWSYNYFHAMKAAESDQ